MSRQYPQYTDSEKASRNERKAKRLRSFDAYDQAVDRAALALLAALRDHANPQFSSVQLEALRLRGIGEGALGYGRRRTPS